MWSPAPSISAAGSEARCDPQNPHSLTPILTDGVNLDVPSSVRWQTILSPILLYPLPSSRRYTIYKPADQATVFTEVLSLTTQSVREKRKGTKEMGTKERSGRIKRLGAPTNL